MSDLDDLMSAITADAKRFKKEAKQDEAVKWLLDHGGLFAENRADVQTARKMVGSQFPYTPEGALDALGAPSDLRVEVMKVADLEKELRRFPESALLGRFLEGLGKNGAGSLLVVAGESTTLITTYQAKYIPGKMQTMLWRGEDFPIHIVGWRDLAERLPWLFHKQ